MSENQKPGKRLAEKADKPVKKKGRGLTILAIIIVVLCIIALALRIYVRPPSQDINTNPAPSGQVTLPSGATNPGSTVNKKTYTCLLIGQRDGMTDTLMVAMLDLGSKTANVVSIPRDTLVEVSRKLPKINGAYGSGGSGDEGIAQLKDELSTVIGYAPASHVMVNMTAFKEVVDAIGGVEFDVPVNMYVKWEGINLKAGPQTLSGNQALQLVRFRGYGSSQSSAAAQAGIDHDDYGRMQVQQMFLRALIDQALTVKNIDKIPAILDAVGKNLRTDMDAGNIAWFAEQVLALPDDAITFSTLPTHSIHYGDSSMSKNYYEVIDTEAALEMINSMINPFTFEITKDMVKHRNPQ